MDVSIQRIRHRWAEKRGFFLDRPAGAQEYILLHFLSAAELTVEGSARRVESGDLIVFRPGEAHCIRAVEPLLHNWMHLTGDVPALLEGFGLRCGVVYHLSRSAPVTDMVAQLESEFFARRAYWPQLAQAVLQQLLITVARQVNETSAPQPMVRVETRERLREIRSRMLSEPWRSWSVAELAEDAHISQSRLQAVYKSIFGVSPKKDLILMKIEKAKRLLHSGMSVTETAAALGYSNVFHFIRQFRQQTGVSPKQYHGPD